MAAVVVDMEVFAVVLGSCCNNQMQQQMQQFLHEQQQLQQQMNLLKHPVIQYPLSTLLK